VGGLLALRGRGGERGMRRLLTRLSFYIFTAWAAITINFLIARTLPGNPVSALLTKYQGQVNSSAIASLTALFGLNTHQNLWQEYVSYWNQLAHGNLGISFTQFPTPVSTLIGSYLPWTLFLVGTATVLSFVIGTGLGIIAGWRRGSWTDALLPATSFLSSIPYFWLGLIAITVLTGPNSWLPGSFSFSQGLNPVWTPSFVGNAIQHAILPAATIVVSSMSGWLLSMRNMMVTVNSEDYITVAHAKGLSDRRVMFNYAARNALLPSVSGFALSLGFIVSGTFLVEIVFNYQGVGLLLLQAIGADDYPLMQGIFLVITLAVLAANFLADLVYLFLDPRTRKEG
jgi:peptide/nickel transport system permease protein